MNTTTSTKQQTLTQAQQAIIDTYQREIVREHKLYQEAVAAYESGHGSRCEVEYHDRQLNELTKERRETLAWFAAQAAS